MSNQNKINSIHAEYSKAILASRQKNHLNATLNSLTEADKAGVELISMIADRVGGQANLNRLVSAYNLIKNSN